jgi:phage terminase large subunit-like protein
VESEDRLAGEDDLAACVVLDGPQEPKAGVRYVIGVDLGLKSDATVACVCHSERIPGTDTPRIVLDRMGVWKGSRLKPVQLGRVEEWVEEVSRRYGRAKVRFDPYQAVHMAQRLKKTGISVDEFTFGPASVGKLATLMLQLIGEHTLALPDDEDLLDELRNVRVKESSPGVFRMDHDRGRHDDRVISLALAASWLVEHARGGGEIHVGHPFLEQKRARERRNKLPTGFIWKGQGIIADPSLPEPPTPEEGYKYSKPGGYVVKDPDHPIWHEAEEDTA